MGFRTCNIGYPVNQSPLSGNAGTMYRSFGKRSIDVAASLVFLVVFAPAMAVLGLAARLHHGVPVLFRQARPGVHGVPFVIFKFRTMRDERDRHEPPVADSERITPLGRFLRSTSLDELPELWNVLRGDMSLVGPRPLLTQYLDRYTPEQRRRHDVRPGITGWAQVHGRNAITWEEKFRLDVWYVDHCSFRLDIRILALTLWKLLTREGITQPGHATAAEFMGTPNQ
jgi:sugar transferase EpsL